MSSDDFYLLSFTCGMNQRYHQKMIAYWDCWDKTIAIAVAILALVSAVIAIWAYFKPSSGWGEKWWLKADFLSPTTAVLTLSVAMVLNIVPTSTKLLHYSEVFQRWNDLRREVDSTWLDFENMKDKDKPCTDLINERYRDLLAQKNSVNAMEVDPYQSLLKECQELEDKSRRGQNPAVENAKPPADNVPIR